MNCFPLFSYIFFILLYIILFAFLFNPKLENIIIIFLFITTFIGGYNLFSDLNKREIFMEFEPIIEVFENNSGLDLLKLILFSPFTTIFIFILLIFSLFGYFNNDSNIDLSYIILISILLFTTNIIQIGTTNMKNIRLSYVLIFPILMTLLSLLFVLIEIYNINTTTNGKENSMPYSKLDKNSIYYKITLMLEILILIFFLGYFVLFYNKGDKTMQYQLYIILFLLYCISGGMVYMTGRIFNKKFLGKVT